MTFLRTQSNRRRAVVRMALAAALTAASVAAQATNYSEGPVVGIPLDPHEVHDLSSVGSAPTNIGTLTVGNNYLSGDTIPYGPVANEQTGELTNQDNDYAAFTIPTGYELSAIDLIPFSLKALDGTIIQPGDLFFIGLAAGDVVNVTPPSSTGLLGYTLLASTDIGSNILPAIGKANPPGFSGPPFDGATKFPGPLGAGTYSLWMLDGNKPVAYKLDLLVSAVPEPASWAMMIIGFGLVGGAMRYRKRAAKVSFA